MTTTLERPRPGIANDRAARRWQRHPVLAFGVRAAVLVLPLTVAAVLGLMAGWRIQGDGPAAVLARVVVAGVVSVLAFVLVERLARRLLPLALLLRLSLVFPDQAPSRFSVALRSTSVKKLQEWARTTRHDDGLGALAEKVVTLAAALNTHDRRTRGHSDRTRSMAELIAVEMGLDESQVNEVRWGAFLHDIGKILVPAALLNKPGKPTPDEWETLKRHPADGGELVEPLRDFLGGGIEAVSGHHENFDGSGYPLGLAGEQIALSARIVSVADSFEVMTAVRSYSRPMTATDARRELARHSGTQFDPAVVRALFNVSLGRLHWSTGMVAWAAETPFLGILPRAVAQAGALAAGPTVSVGTLAGVAAITFGSMAAHAPAPPSAPTSASVTATAEGAPGPHRATLVRRSGTTPPGTPAAGRSAGTSAAATLGTGGTGGGANLTSRGPAASNGPPSGAASIPPPPATGPTLPPPAATHGPPPQATGPTLPPPAATPTPPAQATTPTLPPQSRSPRNP